ncbi:MAG: LCP family protein [Clostridia bacterium]|nr:LCP family protein [Clostridia bacterium]
MYTAIFKKLTALILAAAMFMCMAPFALSEEGSDDWMHILLLGTDVRDTSGYGRTDSMILLSVNTGTKEAKLTSFMRDLWVTIPGHEGKAKLNAACVYGGPSLVMKTISEHFGVDIDSYALVNLSCMADIIDILGGLRLDVTESERQALNKGLFDLSSRSGMEKLEKSGDNVLLNGNQAVAFSRIRAIDSDYHRTERQRTVLTAMAKRLQEENGTTLLTVIPTLLKYVETNMDFTQLMSLAFVGLQMDMDAIEQFRIPADGTYESGTYNGTWMIKANLEKNASLLKNFIYN